jgi:CBS domain-containing protein
MSHHAGMSHEVPMSPHSPPSHEAASRAAARLLEVRTVEIVSGRGRSITVSNVRCPVRGRSAAVEECGHCGASDGVARDALARGEWLRCRAEAGDAVDGGERQHGQVRDAMRAASLALRPGVTRGVAADALRAHGQGAAPVVDGEGRPVGFVGEADLLRARSGARVADAMARVALAVAETAPVGRAAALMASHRLDRLSVVSADGVVVGTISALDLVGWLAGAGGPFSDGADGGQELTPQ